METPKHPNDILLENASDLLFEIHLMRGTCSAAAQAVVERTPRDEAALEQCARLDDTLARMFKMLQQTAHGIQTSRKTFRKL